MTDTKQETKAMFSRGGAVDLPAHQGDAGRGLTWPTAGRLKIYLVYSLVIDIVFFTVYGGMNWYTAYHANPSQFYFDWELSIPFVPSMFLVYESIFLLFLVPLFQLNQRELPGLGKQVLVCTVVAGLVYLTFPGELGFPRNEDAGAFTAVFELLYALARPHNVVPSLHVVYSALIILALSEVATTGLRSLYLIWLGLITVSVVLVHQHHLADVAGSYALVWICRRFLPMRSALA